MTPLFSTSSAAALLSDKPRFTAERLDVVEELPVTHAARTWRRDMHHVESNLIIGGQFCFTCLQLQLQGENSLFMFFQNMDLIK